MNNNKIISLADAPGLPAAVTAFYDRYRERITGIKTVEQRNNILSEVKTVSAGEPKGFVVDETKVTWDGEGYTKYSYHYASERFERPIRKSYRISVHES